MALATRCWNINTRKRTRDCESRGYTLQRVIRWIGYSSFLLRSYAPHCKYNETHATVITLLNLGLSKWRFHALKRILFHKIILVRIVDNFHHALHCFNKKRNLQFKFVKNNQQNNTHWRIIVEILRTNSLHSLIKNTVHLTCHFTRKKVK